MASVVAEPRPATRPDRPPPPLPYHRRCADAVGRRRLGVRHTDAPVRKVSVSLAAPKCRRPPVRARGRALPCLRRSRRPPATARLGSHARSLLRSGGPQQVVELVPDAFLRSLPTANTRPLAGRALVARCQVVSLRALPPPRLPRNITGAPERPGTSGTGLSSHRSPRQQPQPAVALLAAAGRRRRVRHLPRVFKTVPRHRQLARGASPAEIMAAVAASSSGIRRNRRGFAVVNSSGRPPRPAHRRHRIQQGRPGHVGLARRADQQRSVCAFRRSRRRKRRHASGRPAAAAAAINGGCRRSTCGFRRATSAAVRMRSSRRRRRAEGAGAAGASTHLCTIDGRQFWAAVGRQPEGASSGRRWLSLAASPAAPPADDGFRALASGREPASRSAGGGRSARSQLRSAGPCSTARPSAGSPVAGSCGGWPAERDNSPLPERAGR